MSVAVLVVAAGRGTRAAGADSLPKQYVRVGGRALVAHAIEAFCAVPGIGPVLAVIHPDDTAQYRAAVDVAHPALLDPVTGGTTRQASVLAGLRALESYAPRLVLIHDAARPFVEPATIDRVIARLEAGAAGVIAALPVVDTLKQVADGETITGAADRSLLWRAQTPQGFPYAEIRAAHEAAALAGKTDFTDDAAVMAWHGRQVVVVPGSERTFKVTTPDDLTRADAVANAGHALEPRTGTGFDVHRFTTGDHVWLCGVKIPHTARLDGHSDADVGLHALTDALLGAIGDGDIGQHFPPSDEQWRGAASDRFLADARRRVEMRGGRIVNVDVTLLCEAPKISPHRDVMRARIADILGIDVSRVGVKATTTEGLGFTGRREGIAAMASAMVLLPPT